MPEPEKFVILRLTPGVSKGNFLGLLLGVFGMALCFLGTNMVQVWLLEHHVHMEKDAWGAATGTLGAIGQGVTIILAGALGALSDKLGRRKVLVIGVSILAASLWVMPHVTTFPELVIVRLVFSVGRAAMSACFTILIADYVLRDDLGKAGAFQGTMFGFGAMAAVVVTFLPGWLQQSGMLAVEAGTWTFSGMGAFATLLAIGLWFSLSPSHGQTSGDERLGFFALIAAGLRAARMPAVGLSYGGAFAAAANMSVVGAFLTVWTAQYSSAHGGSTAEGLALGGKLLMLMQVGSMCFMPIYGPLMDKLGALRGLILGLTLAAISYGMTFGMTAPGDTYSYVVCTLLGVSQAAMILSAQVFVQSEAPKEVRGTVIGFFSVATGAGGMFALQIGGWLFDAWDPRGPFVLGAFVDVVVLIWAISLVPVLGRAHKAEA
jgi:MFS family permease